MSHADHPARPKIDPDAIRSVIATDCGSTTTKAILIERNDAGEYRLTCRGEAPTTVEAPVEDVTRGVLNAVREIQELRGQLGLGSTDNVGDDNQPRWSPDGSTILFESNRDGANTVLYLMDAPATDVSGPMEETIRLLSFPGFNSQNASWADGSKLIVFSADRDSEQNQNWDIYMMPADGSEIHRLTAGESLERFPVWTSSTNQ